MLRFLKNAFFTGLIILIPVVLLYFAIRELIEALIAVATPIADLLPEGLLEPIQDPEILAAILVVVTAVLLGSLAAIPPVKAAGRWVEGKTLGHLPLYRMIKTFDKPSTHAKCEQASQKV